MMIPEMILPERYELLKSLPEDPPYTRSFGFQTPGALCYVITRPIPAGSAMSWDDPWSVIDGIHQALADDQGLIAVEKGETKAGRRFIYSIVKSMKEPSGVQYCLTMHVEYEEFVVLVQGFFDEMGTTGIRDAMVYAMLSNEGKVRTTEDGIEGWNEDPFDPEYMHGNRMNCSERKEYDELFPEHPLSQMRMFVEELAELN